MLLIPSQIGVTASLEFSLETVTAVVIDISFLFDPQMQPSIHGFVKKAIRIPAELSRGLAIDVAETRED